MNYRLEFMYAYYDLIKNTRRIKGIDEGAPEYETLKERSADLFATVISNRKETLLKLHVG